MAHRETVQIEQLLNANPFKLQFNPLVTLHNKQQSFELRTHFPVVVIRSLSEHGMEDPMRQIHTVIHVRRHGLKRERMCSGRVQCMSLSGN